MFEYDENYEQYIAENEGITFCCDEAPDGYEDDVKRLAPLYWENLDRLVEYIVPELKDMYGEVTADEVREKLGKPQINLDLEQIIYCEQAFDEMHIFTIEYSGDFDEFMYFAVDG